jgi:hypothetical protein
MNEIWKIYPKNNLYEVSNLGNVRSLPRIVYRKDGVTTKWPGKTVSLAKCPDGYPRSRIGKQLKFVHTLVLETFVGEKPFNNYQCCHNNGVRDDNRVENLRWDSPKNNVQDRLKHGTYQIGEKNHRNRYPNDLIINLANSKKSVVETAQYYNVNKNVVYYAKYKKTHKLGIFSSEFGVR